MKFLGNKYVRKKNIRNDDFSGGFTFIETLAVLAITAVFAGEVGVGANMIVQKARIASAKSQIEMFRTALQAYYVDCGMFPTTEQGLNALWESPELFPVQENWRGPYLDKKIPADPWGKEYLYFSRESSEMRRFYAPEGLPFGIVSYGADKKFGGEKNDSDIVSWN